MRGRATAPAPARPRGRNRGLIAVCREGMRPAGVRPGLRKGGHDRGGGLRGVAKCVTGTPWDRRDVAVSLDLLAWDGVRHGGRVGVLITRRSLVQILSPLPTRQAVSPQVTGSQVHACGPVMRPGEVCVLTRSEEHTSDL